MGSFVYSFQIAFLWLCSACTPLLNAQTTPPPLSQTQIGWTPSIAVGVTQGGGVLYKSPNNPQVYLWQKNSPSVPLFQAAGRPLSSVRFEYSLTPSGNGLIIRDGDVIGPVGAYRLLYYPNLDQPNPKPVEIPENRKFQKLPIFSEGDSQFLIFGHEDGVGPGAWKFPLAQYLLDQQAKQAQPTGFYLERFSPKEISGNVIGGAFSPDGSRVALKIENRVEVPYTRASEGYPIYDGPTHTVGVTVLDLDSGETTALKLDRNVNQIVWASDDELLFTNLDDSSLLRYSFSEKSSSDLVSQLVKCAQISRNGNWLIYSGEVKEKWLSVLINRSNQEAHYFKNARCGQFSPDSSSVTLTRTAPNLEKPFSRIELAPLLNAPASETDLNQNGFEATGRAIEVWEVSKEKDKFDSELEFKTPRTTKLDRFGWDLYVEVKNKGDRFVEFKTKKPFGLTCTLFDDKGMEVVSYRPEDAEEPMKPPRLGPGESVTLDCGVVKDVELPPAFFGKIRYSIREYEKVFEGEVVVP